MDQKNEIELTAESITFPEVKNIETSTITEEVTVDEAITETDKATTGNDLLNLVENMYDLTDEQKKEILIENLKKSVLRKEPTTRLGSKVLKNTTTYRLKRERKNKEKRKSRKANR